MKSLSTLPVAMIALVLAGGAAAAEAEGERVLEEVVVSATAPPRPTIELVVVVAEMPEALRATPAVEKTFDVVLAVERPDVEESVVSEIAVPRPTLSL